MKKLALLFAVLTVMLLTNCVKDGEETIIYLGQENYIPPIETIIPQELLDVFYDSVGEIYRGYIPPNVEGKFVVNPKKRVLSNNLVTWPLEVVEPDMVLSLANQHNGVVVTCECAEATVTMTDSVYIMGHNSFFTLYFKEYKPFEDQGFETKITRAMMIVGEVCKEGIRNLKYADIILDVQDNSGGLIVQYPVGQYFIYEDGDGLSRRL